MRASFLILGCLSLLAGCGGSLEAAPRAASSGSTAQAGVLTPGDQAVWWHHVTQLGSAIAWIGPPMVDSQQRRRRQWVMTCTLIGSAQPAMWFQSTVDLDGRESVGMEGGDYSVLIEPEAGLAWGEVRDASQLRVDFHGF